MRDSEVDFISVIAAILISGTMQTAVEGVKKAREILAEAVATRPVPIAPTPWEQRKGFGEQKGDF